ncbi:MAG: aldehyde dehydrogenase family protein, partial [Dehalococcoidia bacterium]|nr:aldehyde dehydrogenase family protein [Dehalococcoidia bacterium]
MTTTIDPRRVRDATIGVDRYGLFLNNDWRPAASGAVFSVTNPATGDHLAEVADAAAEDVRAAIDAAAAALPKWSATPAQVRARMLRKAADLMLDNVERLATIMTLEQGKPLEEAKGEIAYAASFLTWFAGEGERAYGQVIPAPSSR